MLKWAESWSERIGVVPPVECANPDCACGGFGQWRRRHERIRLNGRWFCGEQCLEQALCRELASGMKRGHRSEPRPHRLPLGLVMLSRGLIDETVLAAALEEQRLHPKKKIGECLESLGAVVEGDVTRSLGVQNGLPVWAGDAVAVSVDVPLRLLEASEAIAFSRHYAGLSLVLGFSATLDRKLISACEQILQMPVEPCMVPQSMRMQIQSEMQVSLSAQEMVFDSPGTSTETARSIVSYAQQAGAQWIRTAYTDEYCWTRMMAGRARVDLLFRKSWR